MRAIVLAAGLGKRMRPLTATTPKPLLEVAGKPLIAYHLEALKQAGIREAVINTHWLAQQFPDVLGQGEELGITLNFSYEPTLLETAGGIANNLQWLSPDNQSPFLVVNSDIYTRLDLKHWLQRALQTLEAHPASLACLAMVENPEHNPDGDFSLMSSGHALTLKQPDLAPSFTYSGIGLYRPGFFEGLAAGPQALGPLLCEHIARQKVLGILIEDYWLDVGTPERLNELSKFISAR